MPGGYGWHTPHPKVGEARGLKLHLTPSRTEPLPARRLPSSAWATASALGQVEGTAASEAQAAPSFWGCATSSSRVKELGGRWPTAPQP